MNEGSNSLARRIIHSSVERSVPDGVHIERGQMRANSTLRQRYELHLNALMAAEYISQDEHAARVAAAAVAVTEADLQLLLEDLPALPLTPEEEHDLAQQSKPRRKIRWKQMRSVRVVTYIAGIIASIGVATAIIGDIVNRPEGVSLSGLNAAEIAATVISAVIGVTWSSIMLSTDPMWKHNDLDGKWKRNWSS